MEEGVVEAGTVLIPPAVVLVMEVLGEVILEEDLVVSEAEVSEEAVPVEDSNY
jgi:hypothetical protein